MLTMLSSINESVPIIRCAQGRNFTILNIDDVRIVGLEFRCGGNSVKNVNQLVVENSVFYGQNSSFGTILEIMATDAYVVNSIFKFGTVGNFREYLDVLDYLHMTFFGTILLSVRVGGAVIVTNSNVTIRHSHFEGNSAQIGGALFSETNSNITIDSCTFLNNNASGCNDDRCLGGAVFIDTGCTVVIDNSSAKSNMALSGGGAFSTFQAMLSIRDCVIYSNIARYGGAMAAYLNSTLIVENSQFYNNMAGFVGGVINVVGSLSFVDGNTFNNNSAASDGGVLASQRGSTINIENCTFVNNSVGEGASGGVTVVQYDSEINMRNSLCTQNVAAFKGGVAYAQHMSLFTSENCTFVANRARNDGGVVQVEDRSNASLYNSIFSRNRVGTFGGVIHVERDSALVADSCEFYDNSAVEDGGVIDIYTSGVITIYNSFFAYNVGEDDAGVINSFGMVVLSIYNSTFINNSATDDGGVIYVRQAISVTIDDSTFIGNSAHQGGVATVTAMFQNITTTLTNCTLSSNTADFGGVIATLASGMIVIDHSIFNYNRGYSQGGVVYAFQSGRIFIEDSTFASNTAGTGGVVAVFRNIFVQAITSTFISNNASNDGGAIYAFSACSVTIDYCTFGDNTADDGGVLYARQSSYIAINRSNMTYNKATFGGVMRVRENSGIVVVDSRFLNNMAVSEGGVGNAYRNSTIAVNGSFFEGNKGDYGGTLVAFQSSSLTFYRCSFRNNSANFGGVARIYRSSAFTVSRSNFTINRAQDTGGITFLQQGSNFNVDDCNFDVNEAEFGGIVYTEQGSSVFINNSQFMNNTAEDNGGVINAHVDSVITINNGIFNHNVGGLNGGVIHLSENSTANIGSSTFGYNSARRDGGVFYGIESCHIAVENSSFMSNSVNDDGGVVYVQTGCSVFLTRCGFDLNTARDNGGVIFMMEGSTMSIFDSDISLGEARDNGGVIYGETNCTISIDVSVFSNSTAGRHGGVTYIEDGSIMSISNSVFSYNRAAREGGVISAFMRNAINVSNTNFSYNIAGEKGGAMAIDNSSVTVYNQRFTPQSMIENNSAAEGGGVYLLNSQFYFKGDTSVADNQATERGGGIHAVNSSVIVERDVHFVNNKAEYGGGISLEMNGKLYGLSTNSDSTNRLITFAANKANYGGALYVADETNPVLCSSISSSTNSECFIQSLFLNSDAILMQTMHFSDNSAEISGSNLFGGLLDRCTIRDLPSASANVTNGATSFMKLSGITELETIASDPVRICFCRNELPDCNYNPSSIKVKRGESIDISVVAVDHVNHTINESIIYASLNSTVGSLGEGQEAQRTYTGCMELSYDLLSPHDSEQLLLHAEGPCRFRGISQINTVIQILPCTCPIGFVRSERDKTRCLCDCDPELSSYITECDPLEGSVLRKGNFWIMYVNATISSGGYLIYPNCPLGYCHPPNEAVIINLNVPNGADAQCVSSRSGLLCGTCQPGFSLSIGSSHCVKCSNNWPVALAMILLSSLIAGIALVILLLVLNLTVAVGTLNAIIFFANIVGANSSAFFLSSEITFASVFISWLNLDIGIDSCFFEGMDAYSKTWLQLAFPAYIIFIITMVILFSSCSSKFANLIGKRNPVATLATLLLLSYSKLLQTIISAFSFATLVNPSDRTSIRVWLPDATVLYLNGKHIPLFVAAIIIFLVGLAYTFLLFTWQLFLRSPRARIFNWTRSPKLSFFMDTYHAPYTPRHRYWTGLLLIARAILFLVSATNFSGDPRVTLLSTIVIVSLLFFYKALFNVRIYKNWLISAMETFTYLNIGIFATFTWYTFDTNRNQSPVAHTSVGIVFIMLVFVIAYHVYRYLNIQPFNKVRQSVFCKKLSKKLYSKAEKNQETLADKNTQELFDAIDRDPQEEATHTFLDILESQTHGHQETSSSISNLSSGTEVTSKKSKGSTKVLTFNPNIETKNLLTPLLDNGESCV
jgi:predicted outer membrane repeat protein